MIIPARSFVLSRHWRKRNSRSAAHEYGLPPFRTVGNPGSWAVSDNGRVNRDAGDFPRGSVWPTRNESNWIPPVTSSSEQIRSDKLFDNVKAFLERNPC